MLLLNLKLSNYGEIWKKISAIINLKTITESKHSQDSNEKIYPLIKQSHILSKKYNIVITNPPYMGGGGMNLNLTNFLKKTFPDSKKDLFAVFIEKCQNFTLDYGFTSMITQQSFMFLSSFEKLREKFLQNNIINMAHLGARAFDEIGGEVVQASSFVLQKVYINEYISTFIKLTGENSEKLKEESFLKHKNEFTTKTTDFSKIPGTPIAYWVEPELINAFKNGKKLSDISEVKQGLATSDNKRFLRFWHEVNFKNIDFNSKNTVDAKERDFTWFPYNKGGSFRKWYGNHEYIVNYHNDGYEIKESVMKKYTYLKTPDFVVKNTKFYFKEGITWSATTSGESSFRFSYKGFVFDAKGPTLFVNEKYDKFYILGLLNSKISSMILEVLSPTLDFNPGYISKIPIIYKNNDLITKIIQENIDICKKEQDLFENSWNFNHNSLIKNNCNKIANSIANYKNYENDLFETLKKNESKLNEFFKNIYGFIEIDTKVSDEKISIKKTNIANLIELLISYFVGCLFGRYSLDQEGLIYAGGEWDLSKYHKFIPDDDNIIPVLDSEYFEDDIINKFVEFIKVAFSEETLEENLVFIAKNLKTKGKTNREIIRNYFLNNFYKNHVQMYKKTPIYWLFDSGKNNAFKALIYMHRYRPDLVARVRTDYLHKTQKAIEIAIENSESIIQNSSNNKEIANANKEKNKLLKQLEEIREYDEALAHIANQQIEIDLDDGVKVNYEKFQNVEIITKSGKVKKINLLKKI
jgi:hypothetical protein